MSSYKATVRTVDSAGRASVYASCPLTEEEAANVRGVVGLDGGRIHMMLEDGATLVTVPCQLVTELRLTPVEDSDE